MFRMINNTKNGYADAYSESEAKDYEAKGWARFVPPVGAPAAKASAFAKTQQDELVRQKRQHDELERNETARLANLNNTAVLEAPAPKRGRPSKRIDQAA